MKIERLEEVNRHHGAQMLIFSPSRQMSNFDCILKHLGVLQRFSAYKPLGYYVKK